MSDNSITELIAKNNLIHLNLTRLPKVTAKSLICLAESPCYPQMTYFNLYANSMIEDSGFRALAKQSNIHFLDLCGCKFLSDESVIGICANLRQLKYLNLTWCIALTDEAIVSGVSTLEHLTLLSVFGLETMTDKIIDALVSSKLKQTLETLDINGCCRISICGSHDEVVKLFPNVRVTVFHS